METEYDKKQDERIKELEKKNKEQDEQIEQNLLEVEELKSLFGRYLGRIYQALLPQQWRVPVQRYIIRPLVIFLSSIIAIFGAWDFGVWYLDRIEIKRMVDLYISVAKDIYYKENNPDVALPFVDKALDLKADDPEARFLKAYMQGMSATRNLLNLGRPFKKDELDASHAAYAEALFLANISPHRPEPYVLQGQILSALKDWNRARDAIAKALELAPDNAMAHVRMAMVYLGSNNTAEAEKSVEKALEIDPGLKWAWMWKGIIICEKKKDYEAARACYDKALSVDPKFDMAYYNRGWTFVLESKSKANYKRAREEFKKALEVNPAYKEACYAIGMTYGYENNYSVAKVWMDKSLEQDGDFFEGCKWRGIICGEMKEYEEAISCFDAAIKLDPMNDDLYVRRAKMSMAIDRNEDALRDLNFARELNPRHDRTRMYIGDLYLKTGDAERALACYSELLKDSPKNDDAHARKAEALAVLKREKEALAALDSAISVSKYQPERFWLKKADMLYSFKRYEEAKGVYRKARELGSKKCQAWRGEANACRKLNDEAGWKRALSAYVSLNPTDLKAKKELSEKWH